ncbi:tail fiber protein [Enterobacter phage N5822]|nr:tail fiber protein [Enterobacter phage N5822]
MSSLNVDDILGDILDDILNSAGFEEFKENAVDTANKIKDQAQSVIQNALAIDTNLRWNRVENGKRKAEHGQALELIANETEARIRRLTFSAQSLTRAFPQASRRLKPLSLTSRRRERSRFSSLNLRSQVRSERQTPTLAALSKRLQTRLRQGLRQSALLMPSSQGRLTA